MSLSKLGYNPGDRPIADQGYLLDQFLGTGTFGEAWSCTAPGGFRCALKIIDLTRTDGVREFAMLEKIKHVQHPNLTPIYALWTIDEIGNVLQKPFLPTTKSKTGKSFEPRRLIVAMGLGDKCLAKRLEECNAEGKEGIPRNELLRYMEGAARGLDLLHRPIHVLDEDRVAIIHGDIKPHNILVVGEDAQICDFGLARAVAKPLSEESQTGEIKGTFGYLSPEVLLDNRPATAQSDQYSFAITYIFLRTSRMPYGAGRELSLGDILRAHWDEGLNLTMLDRAERRVVAKATNNDPKRRFTCCAEFVEELQRADNSKTTTQWLADLGSRLVRRKEETANGSPATAASEGIDELHAEGGNSGQLEAMPRSQWRLTLDMPSRDDAAEVLPPLTAELRQISGDVQLDVVAVEEGSVVLVLDIADDAADALEFRIQSGEITALLGCAILGFHRGEAAQDIKSTRSVVRARVAGIRKAGEGLTYDVFLCHNTDDKPAVRKLRDGLQARRVTTWFDEDQLVPGQPWLDELESAIDSIGAVAVCIGPNGFGDWHKNEMRTYINRFVRKGGGVIPVLLPEAAEVADLPTFLSGFTCVKLQSGFSDESLHPLICGIYGTAPGETPIRRIEDPHPHLASLRTAAMLAAATGVQEAPLGGVREAVEEEVNQGSAESKPSKVDPKQAFIVNELLQVVCDQLNSESESSAALRAQLMADLSEGAEDASEVSVDFLARALSEQLNQVMSTLRVWLDSTVSIEGKDQLQQLIDAVAAAGFEASWIEELLKEFEDGHLHVPMETDLYLCEVIFTALYKKPATRIQDQQIDHNALGAIATPSTNPVARAREIRRRLVETHFKNRIAREVGESEASYGERLDRWADRDLPKVLETGLKDAKPWFVLFLETVDALKNDMDIDPDLWSKVLKLERTLQEERFVCDRPMLQERLFEMHKRLDELDPEARKGTV